jgi:hypothetical protein
MLCRGPCVALRSALRKEPMLFTNRSEPKEKPPVQGRLCKHTFFCSVLPLAGLEPGLRLVDDVYTAFATYNPAITVTVFQRAERIANLHGASSSCFMARSSAGLQFDA